MQNNKGHLKSKATLVLLGLLVLYLLTIFALSAFTDVKEGRSPGMMLLCLSIGGLLCFSMIIGLGKLKLSISTAWQAVILVVIVFLPRLILILSVEIPPTSDYSYYYQTALRFVNESPFVPESYMIAVAPNTLAYITCLGTLFKAFGQSLFVGLFSNLLLTTGSVLMLYLSARKVMNEKYAFFCALVFALSPTTFFYSLYLSTEPLAVFTFLLGLWAFFAAIQAAKTSPQLMCGFLSGVALGFSNEVRSNAMAMVIAGALFLLFFSPMKTKNRLRLLVVFTLPFLMVNSLYGLYQSRIFQTDIHLTFGWALYEGLDINTFGVWSEANSKVLMDVLALVPPNEVQGILLQKAMDRASSFDVKDWLTLFLGKGMVFWKTNTYAAAAFFEQGAAPWMIRLRPYIFNILNIPYWVSMGLFVFSAGGLVFTRRHGSNHVNTAILSVAMLLLVITHSFITSIERYHYGLVPLLLMLSFYSCNGLAKSKNTVLAIAS